MAAPNARAESIRSDVGTPPRSPARTAAAPHTSAGLPNPTDVPWAQWTLFVVQVSGLVALVVYVWKTWQMATATARAAAATARTVEEMQTARENASAPAVVVYFANQDLHLAEIVIENFGEGTATDVRCTFDPPLRASNGLPVGRFFEAPKTLPPRSRLVQAFDSWIAVFEQPELPRTHTVTVTYRGLGSTRTYRDVHTLDARAFEHQHNFSRKGLHQLAETLEQFRSDVDRHLRDLRQASDARDAVADLTAAALPPLEAAATLGALWDAFERAKQDPHVTALVGPYLRVMRRVAMGGLLGAERAEQSAAQRAALHEVLLALSDYRFRTLGRQGEGDRLRDAVARLRSAHASRQPVAVAGER